MTTLCSHCGQTFPTTTDANQHYQDTHATDMNTFRQLRLERFGQP